MDRHSRHVCLRYSSEPEQEQVQRLTKRLLSGFKKVQSADDTGTPNEQNVPAVNNATTSDFSACILSLSNCELVIFESDPGELFGRRKRVQGKNRSSARREGALSESRWQNFRQLAK